MPRAQKPYVQLSIDAVDTVVFDPEGRYDPDRYDRYATFDAARDGALTCIELLLDLGDYEDEGHRAELEVMLGLLESAASFDDLRGRPEYGGFLERLEPVEPAAA